ncbi:plastidic glucose transporter 4 [Cordyceps militaris]|uniref:Plastidic glucose transporter 4 n=1 Tax=Cordyceps militaris TaxID=73501 RepID=A0A2H4S722_CORMI|nr:plastidic glucose transporter 4 [Cordyceps militaris]
MDFLIYVFFLTTSSVEVSNKPWYSIPHTRRTLVYTNIIIATGVNAIIYYISILINMISFNDDDANYISLVGGGSLLLGTIPAIFLIETYRRRF